MSETKPDFAFLVGLTEAAAFELVQEHGFVPRVMGRDKQPIRGTCDVQKRRINLYVMNNLVVRWTNG